MHVEELDRLDPARCEEVLRTCCDAPRWAARVAAARPFGTPEALRAAAAAELVTTPEADVDTALAAHPRIGERPAGESSRLEQAAVLAGDPQVLEELAAGNRRYEERFGHVYLVCASGRSAPELLSVLRARLGNDPATERAVVRRELAAITDLRLARLVAS